MLAWPTPIFQQGDGRSISPALDICIPCKYSKGFESLKRYLRCLLEDWASTSARHSGMPRASQRYLWANLVLNLSCFCDSLQISMQNANLCVVQKHYNVISWTSAEVRPSPYARWVFEIGESVLEDSIRKFQSLYIIIYLYAPSTEVH